MEQKQKKEKAISNTGCHLFDGNLTLLLKGKEVKVRCEYFGLDLQRASQEHQLVVLIKQHLPYDELDTGWLVRTKDMDKEHRFGLKARKEDRHWSVYDYNDVVAWGYADGGLNSGHFDSCRMRPEDWPQFAGEPVDEVDEADDEDTDIERCYVKLRMKENGDMDVDAVFPKDEEVLEQGTNHAKGMFLDCAKVFADFRKKHPEITEMHFYTDENVRMDE